MSISKTKHCKYCGRFFKPHPRVGNRQKCCGRTICVKKRKLEAQQNWRLKNPDYFKKRYSDYLRDWRLVHPDYQRLWRKKRTEIQNSVADVTSLNSIRFITPVILANNEIQNVVVLLTVDRSKRYNAMAEVGEIQNAIDISP